MDIDKLDLVDLNYHGPHWFIANIKMLIIRSGLSEEEFLRQSLSIVNSYIDGVKWGMPFEKTDTKAIQEEIIDCLDDVITYYGDVPVKYIPFIDTDIHVLWDTSMHYFDHLMLDDIRPDNLPEDIENSALLGSRLCALLNCLLRKEFILHELAKITGQPIFDKVTWKASQTDAIELLKALIYSGAIEGNHNQIIASFSSFFGVNIKNPDKLLQDIKKRKIGSETLFLDRLKAKFISQTFAK